MNKDETIAAAVKLRNDIAAELKRHNGKISRKAKELTDECALIVSGAMKAGFGLQVVDAMRSRPLPADVMQGAAE